jgi:hypothetical protein
MKRSALLLLLLALLESTDSAASASAATEPPPQGFVGTYHAAGGTVADGRNTPAFDIGSWGIVASENAPSDGGLPFEDGIKFHCKTHNINSLLGMLIAHSEGGTFNNANDTDLWNPLPVCESTSKSCDPRGAAGMLQGAARWSTLAREHCPQIAGVVIDDFWGNFVSEAVPPPAPDCPVCPESNPHGYGYESAGYFCCTWPLDKSGHCERPAGAKPAPFVADCCLWPGTKKGCQFAVKCPNNPTNSTPCAFHGGALGIKQMEDVHAALLGKALLADGSGVDHSSRATTPHLKIYVVTCALAALRSSTKNVPSVAITRSESLSSLRPPWCVAARS